MMLGISHKRFTDSVRDPLFMSWSIATKEVAVGTIDFFPRTAVDTAAPGSPNGTFALSSPHRSTTMSYNSMALVNTEIEH